MEGPDAQNRLLAALPSAAQDRLMSRLGDVSLEFKHVVYEAEQRIDYVYFPRSGVYSLLSILKDGSMIEVGTVGNEGMLGMPVFLGSDRSPTRVIVQVPGNALKMGINDFRDEFSRSGALYELLQRYTNAMFRQLSQSVACNRLHSLEQRCSRWLLHTHDRVSSDNFPLTHEFLASMLGVRRAGVTEVAGTLQRKGLIRYSRGRVTVLDRGGLESSSCECYRVIADEFDRVLQ